MAAPRCGSRGSGARAPLSLALCVALVLAGCHAAMSATEYGRWAPGEWQRLHTSSDGAPDEQFETEIAGDLLYGRFVSDEGA